MLLLQLKSLLPKLPRKNIFFAKLLLFSFFLHTVFLFFIVCIQYYSYHNAAIKMVEISDGAHVILLPLIKTVPGVFKQLANATPSMMPIKQQTVAKPSLKKSSTIQKKSTPKKLQPIKKVALPSKKKKNTPNIINKKPVIEKKSLINKIEKKVEKPLIKKNELPEKKMQQKEPTRSTMQEVGHQDLDLIALCNEIKEGIAKRWKRPANISSMAQCLVKVCVNSEIDREVTIIKSSHALALDIMVKNFLLQYPFPKAIWHKEIELVF